MKSSVGVVVSAGWQSRGLLYTKKSCYVQQFGCFFDSFTGEGEFVSV